MLLCVYGCAYSDPSLSSAPLFLCCADSLPPTGFRSTKLQSVGQHWSAIVWGLPPTRQLGLPRQQLQLKPGWPGGCGGTSYTGGKPPTPRQRTWDNLYRETMRSKVDIDSNTCFHCVPLDFMPQCLVWPNVLCFGLKVLHWGFLLN